ncbi:hypothetical protein IF1G_05504 [Cordyceps javanica]|uniref:Uncharacterized protein n=1 Tax=Cordyceps javanica TaxID=43265 RepID=A0A545V1R8_9HYPO|nr:hypothetical protein IF1G_05504 [Cordyceps javanica]
MLERVRQVSSVHRPSVLPAAAPLARGRPVGYAPYSTGVADVENITMAIGISFHAHGDSAPREVGGAVPNDPQQTAAHAASYLKGSGTLRRAIPR